MDQLIIILSFHFLLPIVCIQSLSLYWIFVITHFQPQATRFYNSQFLSVGRFVKILKLEGSIIQYHEKLDVENPKFILPALNVITKTFDKAYCILMLFSIENVNSF